MVILFFGPPGAGKGTQASHVAAKLNLNIMGTGDVVREHLAASTQLGQQAKSYIDKGHLLPDELVNNLVRDKLVELASETKELNVLFDGYPRTVEQAKFLDQILQTYNSAVDKVFYLKIAENIVIDRLAGRFTCVKCGETYHEKYHLPKHEGQCDKCGHGSFTKRQDDQPQAIEQRLRSYADISKPVIDYYKDKKILVTIDAGRKKAEVTQEIEGHL